MMLWDVASRMERASLDAHASSARAVAFSPDGKILASGGYDGLIKFWDPESGKHWAILRGHNGYVYGLAFASDGKSLASAGLDSTVRLWRLSTLRSSLPHQR